MTPSPCVFLINKFIYFIFILFINYPTRDNHWSDNEHLIEDNVIEYNKVCFDFSLQLLSETFLTERNTIKNVYWSSCKVAVINVIY